jgi:hypothetical protein
MKKNYLYISGYLLEIIESSELKRNWVQMWQLENSKKPFFSPIKIFFGSNDKDFSGQKRRHILSFFLCSWVEAGNNCTHHIGLKIILLFLTKCSIVHHVGLKECFYYWMPNCTPCLMWDILLLLHPQIWGYRGGGGGGGGW